MQVIRKSSAEEMVACFLQTELASERWGAGIRGVLVRLGEPESLLRVPDLADERGNRARRAVLAATRGYGEDRELFEHFPATVRWVWARLSPAELATVRYIEYSYWNELSGGSRLPADAAPRILAGVQPWGVSNERFSRAALELARGGEFPPLILAGPSRTQLVCLEGNLRLTAYALAGFPRHVECLVGTAQGLRRWAA
ncbi:MAG TPA: hypothetical protein VG899_05260 [Mycobacteriales bacterium]|nr:hypothetical protein [Mycobacteriales bacterium]